MKKLYYLFKVSLLKSVKELTRYKFDTITNMGMFYLLFMAMFGGLKSFGGNLCSSPIKIGNTLDTFIVGYFLWTIMYMAYSNIAHSISSDSSRGTLEQIAMSNLGLHSVVIVRGFCNMLIDLIESFIILFLVMSSTGRTIEIQFLPILLIIFIGIFSMFGLGLILGGLAIIYKRVSAILNLVQFFLIGICFTSGNIATNIVYPFFTAKEMIYSLTLNKSTLSSLPLEMYGLLVLNSTIYFTVGIIVFKHCYKKSKKKGLLGQY